jgi:hypothetical protein
MTKKSNDDSVTPPQNFSAVVAQHTSDLRKNPRYDPRKEKELDELYRQYIPPHSVEETGHLLDVAERDAYIDPFPPIGSQKMAGAAIKKGVRVAIGWYIQYIAQQISTFGSGVAQALRSLNKDVDSLKAKVEGGSVFEYLNTLNLDVLGQSEITSVITHMPSEGTVIVSQGFENDFFGKLYESVHSIVIDPRIDAISTLDSRVDTRISEFSDYITSMEDNTADAILVHGRSCVLAPSLRILSIKESARVLSPSSPLILVFPTSTRDDFTVACELTASELWSEQTWAKVLDVSFEKVEIIQLGDGISMAVARNSSLSA